MFHANDRNAPHWSEDFVEHVRTVHFALVGVCLALIGLVQFQKPKDVLTAQYELQEIKAAVDGWDTPEVTGVVRDAFLWRGLIGNKFTKHFSVKVAGDQFKVAMRPLLWLPSDDGLSGRIVDFEKALTKPNSLADFQRFWDFLARPPAVWDFDDERLASHVARIEKRGAKRGTVSVLTPQKANEVTEPPSCSPEQVTIAQEQFLGNILHISSVDFVCVIDVPDGTIILPMVVASKTPVDGLAALRATHPYWQDASFTASFPELNVATADIRDKSFQQIASRLAEEAARPKAESFEIFGVKFPVEAASRWGIVLIVGIQLYLWIHLYELSPKLKEGDPGWDVAWIGVYQSLPAKALFLASTALLPLITIVTLGNHALQNASRFVWFVYVAAVMASLTLSTMITKGVPRHEDPILSSGTASPEPVGKEGETGGIRSDQGSSGDS